MAVPSCNPYAARGKRRRNGIGLLNSACFYLGNYTMARASARAALTSRPALRAFEVSLSGVATAFALIEQAHVSQHITSAGPVVRQFDLRDADTFDHAGCGPPVTAGEWKDFASRDMLWSPTMRATRWSLSLTGQPARWAGVSCLRNGLRFPPLGPKYPENFPGKAFKTPNKGRAVAVQCRP
jgi:hypothetical protein